MYPSSHSILFVSHMLSSAYDNPDWEQSLLKLRLYIKNRIAPLPSLLDNDCLWNHSICWGTLGWGEIAWYLPYITNVMDSCKGKKRKKERKRKNTHTHTRARARALLVVGLARINGIRYIFSLTSKTYPRRVPFQNVGHVPLSSKLSLAEGSQDSGRVTLPKQLHGKVGRSLGCVARQKQPLTVCFVNTKEEKYIALSEM